MRETISTNEKSTLPQLFTGLVRAVAPTFIAVSLSVASIGPFAVGLLGVAGVATVVATPAQARCLIGGQIRDDIPDGNECLEAQRTGCVRNLLTPDQYTSCLQANKAANDSGKTCIIGGKIRNEFSAQDCEEAKATGCVQRLLTPAQYRACLDAQHH
jgi:hypothetical protein